MRATRVWQRIFGGLLVAACCLGVATSAFAQTEGRFTGTVIDQTSAFVPNATVTVINEATGEQRVVQANAQGRYVITNLKPSTYTIRAAAGSAAPLEYTGLVLVAAQEFNLDLQLHPAGFSETITVEGRAPTIDISSARIGVNVGALELENLPVNGRQMSQFMLQAPGSLNAGTGTWKDIHFSGRAIEENAIRYDGVEGSAIIDAAPGVLNGEVPSPFKLQASLENVQEFRIESNNYPAEFGTGTGGQVNVITKSGTNRFKGTVFEYYRNDALDAPNYFDTAAGLPKSQLDQHQFGGSFGGPIAPGKAFFFGSYEAYRLQAGLNFVEAVPSAAAWGRAVPAIQALRPGFTAPNAVVLAGASANPDFDIAQLQGVQDVHENAFSLRVDFNLRRNWSSYVRVFHDQATSVQPEGVTGRVVRITDNPTNAVWSVVGVLSDRTTNDFKLGYNAAPTTITGEAPVVGGVDFNKIAINLSGSVANNGIAGQGSSSGLAVPGGLVRANSATNGHAAPYDPYTLSFVDSLSSVQGDHLIKVGGELRLVRMATDRIGGITYSFTNLDAFLANNASSVQYAGDLSAPSVFNHGATGERHTRQNYYIAYAQDEWHVSPTVTLNYGLRYDYYTPLTEKNDLIVKFNIDTGRIDPNTTPLYTSHQEFQPRISLVYAPGRTVFRTGFGIFVGPGQTEDQIQPVESDTVRSTLSNQAYPIDGAALVANFVNNPDNRSFQPRAYANDYSIPEKVYQYTASVQRELGGGLAVTAAYVGSQGRNLFLRSVANNITEVVTNPDPTKSAFVIREFSIVTRDANGQVTKVANPFAEVDYKTSGGHDSYNALMLGLSRRRNGLTLNAQYTLGKSYGNTGGSNEAQTNACSARTPEQFDCDNGYNLFDVRHTFNFSLLYDIPYGRGRAYGDDATGLTQALLGGWTVGTIINARSGLPVDVKIVRPDVVYVDGAGHVFNNPAAGRTAVINTPRGGSSRNVRRPDVVPGVDPFVESGGLLFLNAAAFATPAPGTYGNYERNSIHGPNFKQADLFLAKHFSVGGANDLEFRMEVFNLFNTVNFSDPVGTLPNALPSNSLSESNKVQPGQPFSAAAGGSFGKITSTVGRTVGLGTPRQIQFALRFTF